MEHKIGDRLKVENELCTIRYMGHIPNWPFNVAYGLEWDNCERGKHSGTVDGKEYFKVKVPGSASFMKDSKVLKKMTKRQSFYTALSQRYCNGLDSIGTVYFGAKKVQAFGFERLNMKNQDISQLERASLSDCSIYTAGSTQELTEVRAECANLQYLDLSYNLFSSFEEVLKLLTNLPTLKSLILSGNSFEDISYTDNTKLHNIRELKLSYCNLSDRNLSEAIKVFPNLVTLELCGNNLDSLHELKVPNTLEELNISDNLFDSVPSFLLNSQVKRLLISKNKISLTNIPELTFNSIEKLDISYNFIEKWSGVDWLNMRFPDLKNLRINGNPFAVDASSESFFQIIARIKDIHILDGAIFSKDLRQEAELYFISQVASGGIEYDKTLKHWSHLCRKYDIKEIPRKLITSFLDQQLITIKVNYRNKDVFEISILSNCTVRYMKSVIARNLSLGILSFELAYSVVSDVIEEFNHEFSPISNFNLSTGDVVFVRENRYH